MALQPFWVALVDAPSLSSAQQTALADVLALRADPATASRFFTRPDVTNSVRHAFIRKAHDPQVLKAVLSTSVVTAEHLLTAAEKMGAERVLVELTRTRWDLRDAQLLLIQQLDHAAARRVAAEWRYFGPDVRTALIDAAIHSQPPVPDREVLTAERRKAEHEAWRAKATAWQDDIWALLSAEPARDLWSELIAREPDEEGGHLVTNLVLNRAEALDDHVLSAAQDRFPGA
ncbi:hypothetical protein [Streptomyces sp. NPDC017529]|uniref:hypothetical protein n=1 Tax=Streptomyces sp. NPDC017529 TaxID=3365000 RepID=UPI0037B3D13E